MKFWDFFTSNGYIYEIILAFLPLIPLIKWRKGWWLGLFPSLFFLIAVSYFVYGRLTEDNLFLSSVYYLGVFSYLIFTVGICSEDGWSNAFFFCTCALLLQHIFYVLFDVGKSVLIVLSIDGFVAEFVLYALLMPATFTAFHFVFAKRIEKNENPKINSVALGVLFAVAFLFVVPTNTYFRRHFAEGSALAPTIIYDAVGLAVCCALLWLLYCLKRNERLKSELEVIKSLREADKRQYEVFKQGMETLNIKYHDLKHSISKASAAVTSDEKWVEETMQSLNVVGAMQKTGNETLDVILVEKRFQCDALEIESDFSSVDGTLLAKMEETDIYTIFGNAIDNAMECLQKVPKDKRFLRVSLNRVNSMAKIQVENYTPNSVSMESGFPETSKKIKGVHGFGIKSIAKTIEKYNGILHYSTEDNMFVMVMIFPIDR